MRKFNLCLIATLLIISFLITSSQSKLRKPLLDVLVSNRLSCGPIFLIDQTTILITHFTYFNKRLKNLWNAHNKRFVGVLRHEEKFVDLEYENGTDAKLNDFKYFGINMYLRVSPSSRYTVRDFSGVAIINDKNGVKSLVDIEPEDLEDLPEHISDPLYRDGKFVFVYPKCCPIGEYLNNETECTKRTLEVPASRRLPVHEVRNTMYNSEPLQDIVYEPFVYRPNCESVLYDESDDLKLLSDGQILNIGDAVLSCLEDFQEEPGGPVREIAFVCFADWYEGVKEAGFGIGNTTAAYNQSYLSVLLGITVVFVVVLYSRRQ